MDKTTIAKNWKLFVEEWAAAGIHFRDMDSEDRKCFKVQAQEMLRGEPSYAYFPRTIHTKDGKVTGFSGKQRIKV